MPQGARGRPQNGGPDAGSDGGRVDHAPPIKLADRVYDRIFEDISLGKWAEGKRIPTENQLCKMFGVSRSVVREALARLRSDGVIVSRQGSGSYVHSRPDTQLLEYAPPGNIAGLLRCVEFRVALEGEVSALAATRRTGEDIRLLESKLENLLAKRGQLKEGFAADYDFHLAVSIVSGNDFFVTTIRSLKEQIQFVMKTARHLSFHYVEEDRVSQEYEEHHLVFRAIRDGKDELARALMRSHLDNTRHRILGASLGTPLPDVGGGATTKRKPRKPATGDGNAPAEG